LRWLHSIGTACLLTVATGEAATACVPPPPPVRFPAESGDAYAARSKIVFQDSLDEDRRALQVRLFDNARSIHLARVATSTPVAIGGWGVPVQGHAITAMAIRTLKGDPPVGPLAMADRGMTSCGLYGGGPATSEKPGALIVVFTGVRLGDNVQDFGLPLAAAREPRLMAALNEAALALRDSNKEKR
jgi:hypothetical protein